MPKSADKGSRITYPEGCRELSEDLGKDELLKRLKVSVVGNPYLPLMFSSQQSCNFFSNGTQYRLFIVIRPWHELSKIWVKMKTTTTKICLYSWHQVLASVFKIYALAVFLPSSSFA